MKRSHAESSSKDETSCDSPCKRQRKTKHSLNSNKTIKETNDTNNDLFEKLPDIPCSGEHLLHCLIYPLPIETFINEYWTKKSYHLSVDKPSRVNTLLNSNFPFHLKTLLQQTPSNSIHCWMKSKPFTNSNISSNISNNNNNDSNSNDDTGILSFKIDSSDIDAAVK